MSEGPTATGTAPETVRKKPGLGPILLTVLLDLLGFGLVIPLLPYFAEVYGASPTTAIAMTGTYSVAQFLFAPIWGSLSDRVGRRPVLLGSIAASVVFLAAFAAAPSLPWLFVFRFLHGACAANISTAQAYIADVTAPEERARGMGLMGAAFGVGFAFGPFVGGELAGLTGTLAAPILLAAALSALNLVWVWRGLPESLPPGGTAARLGRADALRAGLLHPVVGAALLLTFFATLGFSQMEYSFALVAEHVWFPGSTPEEAATKTGRFFGAIGVVAIVIQGGLIGRLAKRFGERALLRVGYLANGLGMLALAFGHGGPETWAAAALMAVGSSLSTPSLSALISRGAGPTEQGAILGANQALSALARALAPWSAMALYAPPAFFAGIEGLPVDSTGAFRGTVFLLSGILMLGALLWSIPALRRSEGDPGAR